MTNQTKEGRPASIIITQILMGISLVPMTLGLIFSLLRGLIADPLGIFSVRAIIFFGIAFGLMIIFLGFGFGGLCRRKIYGYWIGLIFLGVGIAANMFRLAPKVYSLILVGAKESLPVLPGYRSEALLIFDLIVQSLMLGLVIALFAKIFFGRREKLFFGLQI